MNTFIGCMAALLAQATFLHALRWHDGVISVVMIPLVLATHFREPRDAAVIGALCGFTEDVLCGSGLAWTIATTLTVLLANRIAQTIAMERLPLMVATIAFATLLRDVFFWSIERVSGAPFVLLTHDLHMSLWNTLLTAGAAFLLVRPLMRFYAPAKR